MTNHDTVNVRFNVYVEELSHDYDGIPVVVEPGVERSYSAAAWAEVRPDEFVLRPGQRRSIVIGFQVPETEDGGRYARIRIQAEPAEFEDGGEASNIVTALDVSALLTLGTEHVRSVEVGELQWEQLPNSPFVRAGMAMLLMSIQGAYAEEVPQGSPEPYDVLVNNVFFDVYITDALRDVALQTSVPILTDTTVAGFVTLDLFDVPLPDALRQLVLPGGYTVRWMDGYYIIGSAKPDSPLFHLLSVTERVELRHIDAADLLGMLVVPFRDRVRVDLSTNSAIVTGPPEIVERIVADIKKMDVAPYQIRIDALVTEVGSQGREALGLDWSWSEKSSLSETTGVSFTNLVGSIGYTVSGGLDRFLLSLRNEVTAGNAKIRANPNLVTIEGKPASLFVGKVNYYRIVTGTESSPTTRLEAIEAGVSLEITTRVSDDGMIVLDISPSISDVQGYGAGDLPLIGRRRISTTVRVRDGETTALGGLLQETTSQSSSQVPLLGSLPIIGRLFSTERSITEETELIILITPHILHDA